jgi:hypothetical protein
MDREYKVLKLHEALPEGAEIGGVITISDYNFACRLVEMGVLESLNTHVQE